MALISRQNCNNPPGLPVTSLTSAGLLWFIWLISSLLLAGCAEKPPDNSPTGIVRQFYTWRINSTMTGAPTQAELDGMRPLLSRELQDLLQRTSERHRKDVGNDVGNEVGKGKATRRKKPTFVDGDLFSSISAGPTSFTTGTVEPHEGDQHLIAVRFVSAKQLPAINWVDRVKVINEDGHYVLADIEYANHWQLGDKGTLVKGLKKTVRG